MSEKGFNVKLTATTSSYEAGMTRAAKSTETMASTSAKHLKKLGLEIQNVGSQASKYVSLPLVGAGAAALKMSADFDSAFARMQGLAGVEAKDVDRLKQSVLDLAGETAQAPQDLADALYQASSAGLDTEQAMDAVRIAAHAAAAGMGSAADIVSLVASATASYGKANITAAQATDILTASIKAGRADPAELAGSLGRILPIASKLGVSFSEVGGATAFLSNIMGNTSETITALQGFMVQLLSPTQQGKQALMDMGTSVGELHAAIDKDGLMGALDLLRSKGFGANQDALRNLFPDVQAFQGALALVNDTSGALTSTLDATKNSTGDLDTAFSLAADTGGFKMKKAWAEVQVALIKAGEIIMPIVAGVAGAVADLVSKFGDLPGPVQDVVLGLLALVAAAGPLLVVGGSMVKNFNQIKSALTAMRGAAGTATVTMGAIALVLGVASVAYGENQKRKQQLTDATNLFADALQREADGQSDAVKAQIGALITPEMVTNAKKYGLTIGDLADVISGKSIPAFDKLADSQKKRGSWWDPRTNPDINEGASKFVNSVNLVTDALSNAKDQAAVTAKVNDELGVSSDRTASTIADQTSAFNELLGVTSGAADEVGKYVNVRQDLDDTGPLNDDEETAAVQKMTDAVTRQVKALQDDLTAQQAIVDFARRAEDAQYAVAASTDDYNRFLETLPGKLKDISKSKDTEAEKLRQTNELYRSGATLAAGLADNVVTAYDDAANGALSAKAKGDLFRDSMLNSALAASGPARQSILDYVLAVNKVPAEKQVAIVAAIEAGDLTTAEALLDGASETRKVEVQADVDDTSLDATNKTLDGLKDPLHAKLIIDADTSGATAKIRLMIGRAGVFNASASGRFVDHPMISTLGEGGLPEVVLPLTKPGRIKDLMSDRRVSGPILGAVGAVMKSADGRVVNLTHTSVPAAVSSESGLDPQSAADAAIEAQDKVMAREFQRDAISYDEYRAYLSKRKEGLALYSDEEEDLYDRIQQLDETQAKRRDDDAQAQTDTADRIQKYLFDTNQISLADYEKYLAGRLGSYATYTSEWFAISGQILDLQHQMDTAAQDATKAVFDQANAVKSLADAQQANQEADADFNAAGAKVTSTSKDRNATAEDKQAAVDEYNRSAVALAQTAYNLADALANSKGFEDGTVEWARFMRQRLTADSVWNHANGRDNVANAVDRLLLGIPSFAGGGYVPATPGGRLIRVAEAGQGEYMFPANRLHAMAGGGGASVYAPVYHISISGPMDRAGVGRELREILDEHDSRNGRN